MWFVKTTDSSPGAPEQVDGAKLPVSMPQRIDVNNGRGRKGVGCRPPRSTRNFDVFISLYFVRGFFESSWTSSLKTLE